jgi:SSS family solute:Na+ symporter/sodium/proline symporter
VNPLYFTFILVYLVGLIVVGVFLSRRVRTGTDFMIAGRNLSLPVLIGTLVATWIGSGTIIASAGLSYRVGLSALWGPSGAWLGIFLLFFVARRARRFGAFTVPDLLEARYNPTARLLGTIVTLIAYTVITSYQFRAGGMVLNLVAGIDPSTGIALTAVFVIAYTALAGMLSVAYTDLVNGVIITLGILISLPIVLVSAGGWDGISSSLSPGFFSSFHGETSGVGAMNLFLPTLFLLLGESNMYGRFFSARSERVAHRAVFWWILAVIIIETCVVLIGTSGRALYPDLAARYLEIGNASEIIIPHIILTALPPAIGALLLAAVAAVIVSTADSFLLTPATNLQHDVWERFVRGWLRGRSQLLGRLLPAKPTDRESVWFLRVVVILLGIWAFLQTTLFENVLQAALYAYTMYGAGVTPAVLGAFFWKRATPLGGACSVGAGMAATLLWEFVAQPNLGDSSLGAVDPVIPAILISVLTLVLVSLAGKPPEREKWLPFYNEGYGNNSVDPDNT